VYLRVSLTWVYLRVYTTVGMYLSGCIPRWVCTSQGVSLLGVPQGVSLLGVPQGVYFRLWENITGLYLRLWENQGGLSPGYASLSACFIKNVHYFLPVLSRMCTTFCPF